ncbi:CAHM6 protein, partial [Pelecanoides urinatrix]|nr:CAHM6 protein [Pelecanoides urinatrix]
MDKLRGVLDICIRHQTVVGYSIVSLLTAVSEHIFSSVVFKCPCNSGNMVYGFAFLIVPAIILFLLGYMVNARMRRLLTGSCPEKSCSCSCSPCRILASHPCILLEETVRASVAPLTWIAAALLTGSFYVCAASGNSLIKNFPCKDKGQECHEQLVKIPCDKNIPGEFLSLQAESQLFGWLLIACIVIIALISKCVIHCCSPVSYLQLKFWKIYSKKEEEVFEIKAKEHATRLAEINTKCFFEFTRPEEFKTPSNEDWRMISFLYTPSSQEQYYSTLHKYVNTNRGQSDTFREGDQIPPGFGFVDEISANESGF